MDRFIHLPEYRIIICKECQYAVLPGHIDTHLAGKAHKLEKGERRRIADKVASINGLIGNEEALRRSDFPFPPPTDRPITALGQPEHKGLQCTFPQANGHCSFICCSVKQMREHRGEVHRLKHQQRGRAPKDKGQPRPWRTGVHCQRFFVQGHHSRYFEVQGPEPDRIPSRSEIQSRVSQFQAAKQELEGAFRAAEKKERMEIKEFEEAREPNPWLRRVGWVAHFVGLDRDEVRSWVQMPDKDEPELQTLCTAFDWMIQSAQYTAVQEVVGQAALFEANKKEVDKEPNMPFDSWMDHTTVKSYTQVWRQILCYIFRAEEAEVTERPVYKLTARQQGSMLNLRNSIQEFQEWKEGQSPNEPKDDAEEPDESDEEIDKMKAIQRQVLRFCIDLLNHPLQDNEYQSAIISGLAILGMRDDEGWLDAEDYTPKYSGIIKLARLMVVHEAYMQRNEQVQRVRERAQEKGEEMSEDQAREMSKSYFYLIAQLVHKFMTMAHSGQDPTPMQWIFRARSYGFKIRYTTTADGCIQWIGDTVLYQQIRFNMSEVQTMVHGLVREAREGLYQDLLMVDVDSQGHVDPKQVPSIDWDTMVDNPSENRVGWSFLDDERNRFEVAGKWWLYQRMYTEQRIRTRFIQDSSGEARPTIRKEIADAYERAVERFQEKLLLLFHLCGGQPARAPELLGIRWRNSPQGGTRNIFIEDGLVAFVAGYHKGYRSSGNIKIIHRYLPREVGELLVYYLWLVLPFHEKIQFAASMKRCSSAFIWGDGKKVEHRRWTGPRRDRRKDEEESQDEGRRWTSERMRRIMQDASMRWIGVKLNISAWRQIAIAISRRFCRDKAFERDETKAEDVDKEASIDEDDISDLQAGHGSHVAGMIYARELMENPHAVMGRRQKFREVSDEWHRFLHFTSAHDGVGAITGVKRKRQDPEDSMQEAQIARWKRLKTVDIQKELRAMIGEGARFRGQQEEALHAIMANASPILVIMGTGAGKSLLFQLPAHSQKSGTTVVVVPLKTLERSLHGRCQKAGISSIMWDPNETDRMAQIVFVQPESVVSVRFNQYLNRLEGLGQIDRFVFDECHTILDSQADFRPKMKEAAVVAQQRGKQMIFLTATLSPADEEEFFNIVKAPQAKIIRGITSRPNIRYSVLEHPAEVEQAIAVQQLVAQKLDEYPMPAKIIVYSNSIDTIKELGSVLQWPVFFADVGDEKMKARMQQLWENATKRVIIASNAFGLGIDRPDVRVVIHVGAIHRMRNYGQESGRAGRDGQPSEAIIVVGAGTQEALQQQHERIQRQPTRNPAVITQADRDEVERRKVDRFVSGMSCRRVHLDHAMDGRTDRIRCEEGDEGCDVCQEGDQEVARYEALRQPYNAEADVRKQPSMFDSGIEMSSSTAIGQGINPPVGSHSSPRSSPQSSPRSSSITYPQCGPPSRPQFSAPSDPQPSPPCSPPPHPQSSPPSPPPASPGPDAVSSSSSNQCTSAPRSPSPHPPSSPISIDQGFAPRITISDRFEFQCQQDRRQEDQAYIRRQKQQESHDIRDLEQRLEWWVGKCPVCIIRGFGQQRSQHSIVDCIEDGADSVRKAWFAMVKEMRPRPGKASGLFAPYSCCFGCYAPQAICQRWEAKEGQRGKWHETSRPCQFKDIVMPVFVSIMSEGEDWVQKEFQGWVQESGVDVTDKKEVYKWSGQKVIWGGIEASKLCQVFYWLTKMVE